MLYIRAQHLMLPLLGGGLACSSPTNPSSPPTLLVTNPTCSAGPCRTVEVRLFNWNLRVPQPFWGYKVIGETRGPTTCLTFPAPWTFRVIGQRDTIPTSPIDTVVFALNNDDPIFLVAKRCVAETLDAVRK